MSFYIFPFVIIFCDLCSILKKMFTCINQVKRTYCSRPSDISNCDFPEKAPVFLFVSAQGR